MTKVSTEVYRILKPGGFYISFSQGRLYHRMAVAIEDCGFEIRDMLVWKREGQAKAFSQNHFVRKMKITEKDINKDMPTGEIEVEATDIEIFTASQELPFSIEEVRQKDGTLVLPNEDLRLKYRYLDLRRDPITRWTTLLTTTCSCSVSRRRCGKVKLMTR